MRTKPSPTALLIIIALALFSLLIVTTTSAQSAPPDPPAPSSAPAAAPDPDHNNGAFHKFFVAGGLLVWVILLPLSLVTVSLIIQFFLLIRRQTILPPAVLTRTRRLLQENNLSSALAFLKKDASILAQTIHTGLTQRAQGLTAAETAIAEILEQNTTILLRKIEWLNIIGNVAPMVGLFGTVWGMINAFDGIVRAGGQPEPAELAGGISVALVTTWWGLVVAIPALAAYGFLRNRIDSLTAEAAVTAENLVRSSHQNKQT